MTARKQPAPPKGKPAAAAKKAPAQPQAAARRTRTDWDAVERDYRAGNMTLRELASKHGGSHQAIAKKAKAAGWSQDLTKAIRAATNARVIADTVAKQVATSGQEVANVVLAAAELNKQVILGHRTALRQLAQDALNARQKLLTMAESAADIRETATVVSALEASARTLKLVIDKEREAFSLNDQDDPADKEPPPDVAGDPAAFYNWLCKQATR